jgi:hypothetical protein
MTSSLLGAKGRVCNHNDDFALIILTGVHASMKGNNYDVMFACTEIDLLAASCTCDSGPSEDNDRHTCIHDGADLFCLILLLFYCLVEHILCELACQYGQSDSQFDSPSQRQEFIGAIKLLVQASGRVSLPLSEMTTLRKYLSDLSVRTEKQKMALKPPNPNDLGPMRDFQYVSPVKKVKEEVALFAQFMDDMDDNNESLYCPSDANNTRGTLTFTSHTLTF